jgi:cytochrome c553
MKHLFRRLFRAASGAACASGRDGAVMQRAIVQLLAGALLLTMASFARAADDPRALQIVMGKCFLCHGADGESSSPLFPRLAGQHAAYVARQLADYKAGRRKSDTMRPMVDDLSVEDFALLGRYFESRKPAPHAQDDPELAQVGRFIFNRGNPYSGIPPCAGCHGNDGHGTDALPRLAGQHALYIENQLKKYNARERTNDNTVMHSVASKLSELEVKAVSAYVSGLK